MFSNKETPTKELSDHSSGSNSQVPEFSSPVPTASYLNRFTNSESSTDEEGNTETHQLHVGNMFSVTCSDLFTDSQQVVVLSGMMTSPPLHLPSCPRQIKTQYPRPCPHLQHLVFLLRHPLQGAYWSPAGPAPQTTPVFPSHLPALLASPLHILLTLTSNKEAS